MLYAAPMAPRFFWTRRDPNKQPVCRRRRCCLSMMPWFFIFICSWRYGVALKVRSPVVGYHLCNQSVCWMAVARWRERKKADGQTKRGGFCIQTRNELFPIRRTNTRPHPQTTSTTLSFFLSTNTLISCTQSRHYANNIF